MPRRRTRAEERDRLRDALCAADPAAERPDLPPETAARIRAAMRSAVPGREAPRRAVAAVATAALAGAVLLAAYALRSPAPVEPPDTAARAVPAREPGGSGRALRIEYTASNDVRIVWTVDPGFRLDAPDRRRGN